MPVYKSQLIVLLAKGKRKKTAYLGNEILNETGASSFKW